MKTGRLQRVAIGIDDVRRIGGKVNDIIELVQWLCNMRGEGCVIDEGSTGPVIKVSTQTPKAPSASSSFTMPWKLELDGADIKSTNAVAYWYGEQVLLATENSPLTWTAPALGASLYVDVSYSSGWSCVAATAAGSTAGHQYYLVGKYESDGSITQYQHGILRIGDRYQ